MIDMESPESTEETLQAFMEVHQDIMSKADEFEPLRLAGESVRAARFCRVPLLPAQPPPTSSDALVLAK